MDTDEERRHLYDQLDAALGPRAARLLMAHLPPAGWADLATKQDVDNVRIELRGELAELRGEMAELRAELRGEMAELRGEMASQLPKVIAANIAAMIGITGVVLGSMTLAG